MGLIDIIDDRDVNNYFTSLSQSKDMQKQWLMELKADNPTVKVIPLGNAVYQLDMPIITCTGANVDIRFRVVHSHKLIRMGFKHTDSNDVDSINPLAYSISKRHHSNLWMLYLSILETTASDILDKYVDYYMEPGEYLIKSTTDNTDKLFINVIIQITGA